MKTLTDLKQEYSRKRRALLSSLHTQSDAIKAMDDLKGLSVAIREMEKRENNKESN